MSAPARQFADLWPELAELIGADGAQRLLAAFAGRRIYVPRAAGAGHPLARAVGAEKAAILCEYFHGTEIDLPVSTARRQRILDLKRQGRSNGEIATMLLVSERHVRDVMANRPDDRQLPLFPKSA